MWLSKKLRRENENNTPADLGVTTIGGRAAGVYARGERRDLQLCMPRGLVWQPCRGDHVVVLKGGNGGEEAYVLGVQTAAAKSLEDGEILLYSKGASIHLKNDGRIELEGQLLINGMAYTPCNCSADESDGEEGEVL